MPIDLATHCATIETSAPLAAGNQRRAARRQADLQAELAIEALPLHERANARFARMQASYGQRQSR